MAPDKSLEESVTDVVTEDNHGGEGFGYYHPSQITGCSLKSYLDWVADIDVTPNSWMFAGTSVHYYMEKSGRMERALIDAGFDIFGTNLEVSTTKDVGDGVKITGQADVVAHKDGERHIYDLKYSSIPVHSGHGRLYKYLSQVNTYSFMFDADKHGLIVINSKSNDLTTAVDVVSGEPQQDNWDLTVAKAKRVHAALEASGYEDGFRYTQEELDELSTKEWKDILDYFDRDNIPSYDKECQYCEHSEYCPIKNGNVSGGLLSFKGGK